MEQIRANNKKLRVICDKVLSGEVKVGFLNFDDFLRIGNHVCVPKVGDLIRLILEVAHSLRYFIYHGATKMNLDLKQHY